MSDVAARTPSRLAPDAAHAGVEVRIELQNERLCAVRAAASTASWLQDLTEALG